MAGRSHPCVCRQQSACPMPSAPASAPARRNHRGIAFLAKVTPTLPAFAPEPPATTLPRCRRTTNATSHHQDTATAMTQHVQRNHYTKTPQHHQCIP
eukprot:9490202-Pyramimonas_sp.AAC.1